MVFNTLLFSKDLRLPTRPKLFRLSYDPCGSDPLFRPPQPELETQSAGRIAEFLKQHLNENMPCYQSIGPEIETARVVLGDQVHPPAEARREGDAARDGTVDPEPVVHRHVICQMHSEAVARKDEMLGERDIRRAEILVALAAGGREPPAVRRREELVRADRDRRAALCVPRAAARGPKPNGPR